MIASAKQQLIDTFSESRLFRAWEEVAAKKSAPGFDHVTIEDFSRNPGSQLRNLRNSILQGHYRPDPLVTFFKEKPNGSLRTLNIATVRDRVVCRVLADVMAEKHDRDLQPQCYAYRPHRGAFQAVRAAQQACRKYAWAARVDIADFFDSLNHEIMLDTLSQRGWSEPVIQLIQDLARAPRFDGVQKQIPDAGVPMGLPIAPVLSNLYLDDFDRALQHAGLAYLRYADDIVIFAPSDNEANAALAEVRLQLDQLHLQPNTDKTRIYQCKDGFLFLGFLFRPEGHTAGHEAVARLRSKLAAPPYDDESEKAYRTRRAAIKRGWCNYYQREGAKDQAEHHEEMRQRPKDKPKHRQPRKSDEQRESSASTPEPADQVPHNVMKESATPASRHQSHIQTALSECRDLEIQERHMEIIYKLRRILGDELESASPTEMGQCRHMLATAYEALGLIGAADICRNKEPKGRNLQFSQKSADDESPMHSATDVENWLQVFGGDQIRIARQFVDRLGRHGYRPATHGLSPKDLQRHWEGRETLAAPVYRHNNKVQFAALDFDISRKTFDNINMIEREALLEKLLDDARHIQDCAAKVGIRAILEDSGCKGYHLWFFLHAPIKAELLRDFLQELCRVAGPAPEGTHRELFPASDHAPQDAIGRFIKLPLGIHRLTQKRSRFLAPDGLPCQNGVELLGRSFRNRADVFRNALHHWKRYQTTQEPAKEYIADEQNQAVENNAIGDSMHPDALHILSHCSVLAGIRKKALQEHHLTHAEHSVVRGILAPLQPAGQVAIHEILKPCRNYSRTVTDRFLLHEQTKPMGCNRIREILGDFCNETGCNCKFRPKKSDYANPLRWLDTRKTKHSPSKTESNPDAPTASQLPTANVQPEAQRATAQPSTRKPVADATDITALLTSFHKARKELLETQALLIAATHSPEKTALPFGNLHKGDPDPDIFRWTIQA